MKIDRVIYYGFIDSSRARVRHFIVTDAHINFIVQLDCSYEKDLKELFKTKEKPDVKKLKPTGTVDLMTYNYVSEFEEEHATWVDDQAKDVFVWEDIKPDKLFFYAINSVSKLMIKDTLK